MVMIRCFFLENEASKKWSEDIKLAVFRQKFEEKLATGRLMCRVNSNRDLDTWNQFS
jgi:hypothetical protein